MVSAIAPVGQIDFLNVRSGEVGVDVGVLCEFLRKGPGLSDDLTWAWHEAVAHGPLFASCLRRPRLA